jgi:hypothetical protein
MVKIQGDIVHKLPATGRIPSKTFRPAMTALIERKQVKTCLIEGLADMRISA